MRICICDDDLRIHNDIKQLIGEFFSQSDIPDFSCFSSGEELLECYLQGNKFDIIFLDVEMSAINGIETAEEIRKKSPEAIIVFVSSHKNYVFDAFRCEALHFLVKPINKTEFENVFSRAVNKYKSRNNFLPLQWQNSRMNIKISDIYYVEGYRRHLKIYTANESVEAQGNITSAYEKLREHGFLLIHQGYLVNMQYIKRFNATDVVLENGAEVMMSARRRADALIVYNNFVRKWKW
ncbi:MAG: response regulator transcription factor [Clostridia bacterium]|nr:response regulator transcription factor [Clostridia bacterium]